MGDERQKHQNYNQLARNSRRKAERLQQLMEDCQQEVLRQIIGPFGLTPAMFNDKDGGNVATVHNAEKGIFPDKLHEENFAFANEPYSERIRQEHLDVRKARGAIHQKINKEIDSGYEGRFQLRSAIIG